MNKRCTIKDVAQLAGVSVGTASMALNGSEKIADSTRERVMDAVKKLEYRRNPYARTLGSQKSYSIGLVVTDLSNPFFGTLVELLQDKVSKHGYDLVLGMSENRNALEKRAVSHLIDNAVDGMLIVPAHDRNQDVSHIQDLQRYEIPYVFVTSYYPDVAGDCVMTDLSKGSYELTRHLLETDRQRITIVSGYSELVLSSERIRGFMDACAQYGIQVEREQIVETEPDYMGGYRAMNQILERGIPDAILAVNDMVAMGIIKRAKELNLRVPEDIAVAGYDDLLFSSMLERPLTTVRQPLEQISEKSVEYLIERIEKPELAQRRLVLMPEVCLRESTKRLK